MLTSTGIMYESSNQMSKIWVPRRHLWACAPTPHYTVSTTKQSQKIFSIILFWTYEIL